MSTPTIQVDALGEQREPAGTGFIWLELTGSCQLQCSHCYAESGPGVSHGSMTEQNWSDAIKQAALSGVTTVQFIGGEPTTHPAFSRLVTVALVEGLNVEVFSNLFSIAPVIWESLAQSGVRVATSYYSATPYLHDRITKRMGSHARTMANIREAVRRQVSLRVGLIQVEDGQDIDEARAQLQAMGVRPEQIHADDVRAVGRAIGENAVPAAEEDALCGNCASGVAAVLPDGSVHPCVFSRQARFEVGNLVESSLSEVLNGSTFREVRSHLATAFSARTIGADCSPADPGGPRAGGPSCSPACSPVGNCNPVVNPGPCNPFAGHPPQPEPTPRPDGPVCGPYNG